MATAKIVLFYGSVRPQRRGIRLALFLRDALRARGLDVTFVDPLEYAFPLLQKRYNEFASGTAPNDVARLGEAIVAADGFVVVSGEYNHMPPPALVNLLDYYLEEFEWRPCAIATYSSGQFGGVRAGVALRTMLAELGMASIPTEFPVPHIDDAFDEDGKACDPRTQTRVTTFLDELCWYVDALRAARKGGVPQ